MKELLEIEIRATASMLSVSTDSQEIKNLLDKLHSLQSSLYWLNKALSN